jgi:hypothetical protein
MKYRKKPVVIEAVQFTDGGIYPQIVKFCDGVKIEMQINDALECRLIIPTLEGDHVANQGDYIIKGVKGEFYPCKPDIFEMTYEKVEE